jgi:nucleoid-associated protein YgaU
MPNDAKLGMIVGVGLVIAIAVVFFRKDGVLNPAAPEEATAAAATRGNPPTSSAYRGVSGAVPAKPAIRTETVPVQGQRHTVVEGETLFSLAKRYYHDEKKFVEIYRVNQEVLESPDRLTPGTVLIIPDLP